MPPDFRVFAQVPAEKRPIVATLPMTKPPPPPLSQQFCFCLFASRRRRACAQRWLPEFPARQPLEHMDRDRDVGVGCAHGAGVHDPAGMVRGSQAGAHCSIMIGEGTKRGGTSLSSVGVFCDCMKQLWRSSGVAERSGLCFHMSCGRRVATRTGGDESNSHRSR